MKSLIPTGLLFGAVLTAASFAQKDTDTPQYRLSYTIFDSIIREKNLDSFPDAKSYEEWCKEVEQECLDSSGGRMMGFCYAIEWDGWVKEVYTYSDRLKRSIPDSRGKIFFDSARREWELSYTKSTDFAADVFSRRWDTIWGTMYIVIRDEETNSVFVPMVEQHALLLRSLAYKKPMEKERPPEYWDSKLNLAYRKLMHASGNPGRALLHTAEMQWIKARDTEIKLIDYVLAIKYKSRQYAHARIERTTEKRNMVASIIRQRATMFDTLIEFSKPAWVRYKKWIDG